MTRIRGSLRRTWKWLKGEQPPDGPGPGGGPNSESYNRARAESELGRFRDAGPGSFGGS